MIAYCAVEEASVFQQSHNNLNASVLVLNHTYEPLNVTSTRRAIILVFKGKAEVVKHNAVPIRSFNHSYERPIVVRLLYYARRPPVHLRARAPANGSPALGNHPGARGGEGVLHALEERYPTSQTRSSFPASMGQSLTPVGAW